MKEAILIALIVSGDILKILALVFYPAYLILFIKHWLWAGKVGPGLKPSFISLILYTMIFVFLCYLIRGPVYYGKEIRRQAEVKSNLHAIFLAQSAYFSETNFYAGREYKFNLLAWNPNGDCMYAYPTNGKNAFEVLGWKPEGETRYAYCLGDDMIPNTIGDPIRYLPWFGDWPLSFMPESTQSAFTAVAVGNIDDDIFPDVWIINDAKTMKNIVDDRGDSFNEADCPGCPQLKLESIAKKNKSIWKRAKHEITSFIFLWQTAIILYIVLPLAAFLIVYFEIKKYSRLKSKAAEADEED